MSDDLISRSALKKKFQGRYDNGNEDFDKGYNMGIDAAIDLIDKAPTVDAFTEDDVKYAIKEGHEVGYEMAKAKFERPTEVNCSHCDYFTFSKRFIENVVELMLKYKIETVDDLMTELNRINELIRVKDELNNELNELKESRE